MNLFIIFIIFLEGSFAFQSQDEEIDPWFDVYDPKTYEINDKSLVIKGNGIMNDCYKENDDWSQITHLVIEETVKRIGNKCFSEIKQIQTIELKEGIEIIGIGSFQGLNIKEITIPSSVRIIQTKSFANCFELE